MPKFELMRHEVFRRFLHFSYVLFALLFFCKETNALSKDFANKEYYLIDSLELDKVADADRKLIDSCISIFHQSSSDTAKIHIIEYLVEECWDKNIWPKYNDWILEYTDIQLNHNLAPELEKSLLTSKFNALKNKGYYYELSTDIPKALEYYFQSLELQKKLDNQSEVARSYNNIAYIYRTLEDIPKALEYYHRSLTIMENLNDQKGIAMVLNNLGNIYMFQDNLNKGLEYYQKSFDILKKIGDREGMAREFNNLGKVYEDKEELSKALEYYLKSLKILEELNHKKYLATVLNNIGVVYKNQGNLEKAHDYLLRSKAVSEETANLRQITVNLHAISNYYLEQGDLSKAQSNALKMMELAKQLKHPPSISNAASLLSDIYSAEGNYQKALEMYQLHITMNDSINNEKNQKATFRQQARYDFEKKQLVLQQLHDEELRLQKVKRTQQLYIGIITALLFVIFIIFILNRNKQQRIVLEKKLQDSTFSALQAQMNPHFIFNALNSIQTFIATNSREKSEYYLGMFSKLMRSILASSRESKITLSKELESLRCYLELEQLRCNHKFEYTIEVSDHVEIDLVKIPPMLIQPYVENAIIHGILHKKVPGHIHIFVKETSNKIIFVVEDDGIGRKASQRINSATKSNHKSYGVLISQERIDILNKKYRTNFNVVTIDLNDDGNHHHNNTSKGTRVVIEIPIEN